VIEQVWTVVQAHPETDVVEIIAMLPKGLEHHARTLAQTLSIGAPHNRASALLMSKSDAVRALMLTQFGMELTLKAVENSRTDTGSPGPLFE
jgi:hypothetical protein